MLTFGVVTDLHFGPAARFDGKLRKLTHEAEPLTRSAVAALASARVDYIVNLGDDIEDEARDQDLARYELCQSILRGANLPLVNVAGNHDVVHLGQADLNRIWGREGPLYYAFDAGLVHVIVLHTLEKKDVDVRIPEAQLRWLGSELAAAQKPVVVFVHHSLSEQDLSESRWFSRAPHLALVRERRDVRALLEASGKVRLVVNGHVHRNHLDVIGGIPYVTVQSLIENLDDDAPGRPAASHALVQLDEKRIVVRVRGNDPAAYQFEG